MKSFHVIALTCFAIAMAFYLLAWVPGLVGFSIFGLLFEAAAWIQMFSHKESVSTPLDAGTPQYGPITRLAALILGVAFLIIGSIVFIASLLVRDFPLWLAVFSIPFVGFGWLLFSTARSAHDPEWFYDALDVSEHETGKDKNES